MDYVSFSNVMRENERCDLGKKKHLGFHEWMGNLLNDVDVVD